MRLSSVQKTREYCKIAGQLHKNPSVQITEIAARTGLSRNTVTKYMERMYSHKMLIGPWMSLKPHSNYREYVYLMNFSDPSKAFKGLKGFPHVVYCESALGSWNTMVMTDRLLDFSRLKGFENVVYQGKNGHTFTPEVRYSTWQQSVNSMYEQVLQFSPSMHEFTNHHVTPVLEWGSDEWMLYNAFKKNLRKKVVPVLRKIDVRYETYAKRMKTVQDHCTIHTGFYPQGFEEYKRYCFLLATDYKKAVTSLFSLFPTTTLVTDVDEHLLVFVNVPYSKVEEKILVLIYDMKRKGMIKQFRYAEIVDYSCIR